MLAQNPGSDDSRQAHVASLSKADPEVKLGHAWMVPYGLINQKSCFYPFYRVSQYLRSQIEELPGKS